MTVEKKQEINHGQDNTYKNNIGKSWPQILAVFAVALGPFTNGILYSWSSPFALVITKDKENYNVTEDEASYFIVFQPLGMIFASLFFFKIAELLGSKKSVLFLTLPHLTCWIIIIFAKTKWDFYASRFIGGIGDSVFFCTITPYIGEIASPSIRGYFGNLPVFTFNGGIVFITVIGSYCDVKTTAYICMGIPVLFAVLVSLLPESPYQLIRDGKYDAARRSIRWLTRKSNIEEEFLKTKADVERQISERGNWQDLIKIESNRKALRAGIFLRVSQQFCGMSVFVTYTQRIFEKAGSNITPQYSSMISVSLTWICGMLCSVPMETFGRRPSYICSLLSCGSILVMLSSYFLLEQYSVVNLDQLNWFPLAGLLIYGMTYASGLGLIPTLMMGELFSASIKAKALCICMIMFGLVVFITSNLFNILTANFGLYSPFLVYGLSCFLSAILTLRWLPETKGKTLEEIQQALKNR